MHNCDKESERRHEDELPIPIAFPINNGLMSDPLEHDAPPSGLKNLDRRFDNTAEL